LSKEEVLALFNACRGTREKALCSFMYESGCRSPDELLHMKVGDVEFDEYGAKVKLTSGKVGTRIIRVVSCVPHLKAWVNDEHPDPKPDNWMWVSKGTKRYGEPIGYESLKLLVRKWRNDAGIEKKITSYTFRRTRYTHLSSKWPTPVLYKYMGQVQGSKVIDRYVELNEDAVDDAVLNFYGMKAKENGEIKPLFCSRCNKQNSPELEYCDICHAPLTEKAIISVDKKKGIEMRDMFNEMVKKFKEEMKAEITLGGSQGDAGEED
jgi:integrase